MSPDIYAKLECDWIVRFPCLQMSSCEFDLYIRGYWTLAVALRREVIPHKEAAPKYLRMRCGNMAEEDFRKSRRRLYELGLLEDTAQGVKVGGIHKIHGARFRWKDKATRSKTPPTRQPTEYTDGFEAFWAAYPRKKGKPLAFRYWQELLKAGVEAATLVRCATHYAQDCERQEKEEQYIQYGSTFLGEKKTWEDYIEPPAPTKGHGPDETPIEVTP